MFRVKISPIKEDNTPASKLKPQIHGNTKKRRQKEIMQVQQEIAFKKNEDLIGNEIDVLIEGKLTDEEGVYIGRTYMDAPSVDGYIFVNSDKELLSGEIITAIITNAENYDLIGTII